MWIPVSGTQFLIGNNIYESAGEVTGLFAKYGTDYLLLILEDGWVFYQPDYLEPILPQADYDTQPINIISTNYAFRLNDNYFFPTEQAVGFYINGSSNIILKEDDKFVLYVKVQGDFKISQIPFDRHFIKKILEHLFDTDEKLSQTKPTKSYDLDPEKVELWKRLNMKPDFTYQKISFDDLLEGWSIALEQVLTKSDSFLVSSGFDKLKESVSELWTAYIMEQFFRTIGWTVEMENNLWFWVFKKDKRVDSPILIADDFIRSGIHMSNRILKIDDILARAVKTDKIYLVVAVALNLSNFLNVFNDISTEWTPEVLKYYNEGASQEIIEQANKFSSSEEIKENITRKIEILSGIIYRGGYIIFDHNSVEKYDDEIAYGYVSKIGKYIGSLIEGDSNRIETRYPPPLYHLVFGNGQLPKKRTKLVLEPDGFYQQIY